MQPNQNKRPPPRSKEQAREYYLRNKDQIRKQQATWQAANPTYNSEYRVKNKERCEELSSRWAKENPEKIKISKKKSKRKWNLVNPEKVKASIKKWRDKNCEIVRAYSNSYRRVARQNMPSWVNKKEIRSIYIEAQKQGLEVDHIVPLRGKLVSGLHVPWNLQLLSKSENCSKQNKYSGV